MNDLAAVQAATAALMREARGLSDDQLRQPSLCPGWTRAHVLSHLAANADGLRRLLTAAANERYEPMHASTHQREAEIETGALLPASELVGRLERVSQRFYETASDLPPRAWTRAVVLGFANSADGSAPEAGFGAARAAPLRSPDVPASIIPFLRLTELLLHHVDLMLGFTPAHWPALFVSRQLGRSMSRLAVGKPSGETTLSMNVTATDTNRHWTLGAGGPSVFGLETALLAWLTGRSDGHGLHVEGGPLPPLPPWG